MRAMSTDPKSFTALPRRVREARYLDGTRPTRSPGSFVHRRFGDGLADGRHRPRTRRCRPAFSDRGELAALDDLVDDAVLLGLLGREDAVALDVVVHLLGRAVGVLGERVLQQPAHAG